MIALVHTRATINIAVSSIWTWQMVSWHMACMRMFINADECGSYGGAFKQSNSFKNKITASKSKMENKGLDAVPVSGYANYLLTTNNDDAVRVETSDRRFVILQVGPELKKPPAFFKKLYASIEEGAGVHLTSS